MRIAVCGKNPVNAYSGGRYYAWMMSEALASCGHEVTVWTDNVPVFLDDFSELPAHDSINLHCSPRFEELPEGPFDVVVLVPHMGWPVDFFAKTISLAKDNKAKLALLNFESANWFNELSPEYRDPALWDPWLETSSVADLVLSLAKESTRYARDFYTNTSSSTLFRDCYPSVNSLVADQVGQVPREKQIICITRFARGHAHKGGGNLVEAIGPAMAGYELAVIVGTGNVDQEMENALREKAAQFDVGVRFLYKLSDQDKFREIKRSSLMLFLSHFEGFGYPPVEAQYCDVPCITYDLPVLREVSGEGLIYVQPGDTEALQENIREVLSGECRPSVDLSEHIASVAKFESYVVRIDAIFQELGSLAVK